MNIKLNIEGILIMIISSSTVFAQQYTNTDNIDDNAIQLDLLADGDIIHYEI